jgi:high-affinity iron transporter
LSLLGSYLIGIREGLEAALIISILASYLRKVGQKHQMRQMMAGVVAAIVASIVIGLALSLSLKDLPPHTEENITGFASILAVGFITWMIFWMANNSHKLSSTLRGGVDKALAGSAFGLVAVAFVSVIREGIETSISLWTAAKATGGQQESVIGAVLGLVSAAVIGYLIYRGSVRINLGLFFKITGAYLVLIAASIFAYAFGEFNETGLVTFLNGPSYDLSGIIAEGSFVEVFLKGAFGFIVAPTLLQTIAWVSFAAITGWLYLKPRKTAVA